MGYQKGLEQKILSDIEKLELVFEAANEGFFYMMKNGKTRFYNRSFYESFDIDIANNSLENWKSIVHPDDRAYLQNQIDNQIEKGIDSVVIEYRVINKSGEIKWIEALGKFITDEDQECALIGYHADITVKKAEEEQIERLAFFDPLTKLYNRNYVHKMLDNLLKFNQTGYLIYIDLNNFKSVNTTFGYDAGDAFLIKIAEQLMMALPGNACVARNYVDEYMAILPALSPSDLNVVVDALFEKISAPFTVQDKSILPQYHICIYPIRETDTSPNQILHRAHIMVSFMKSRQQLGIQFYNQDIEYQYLRQLEIEQQLPWSLDKNEIFVVFQPIVETRTGVITSFEALLRWNNSELGFVGPDEFIPVAERNGYINRLGEFVLKEACSFLKERKMEEKSLSVSINLSIIQLYQADYLERTMEIVRESGITCDRLIFEVTESVILQDEILLNKLRSLHENGIKLAIDDFGTGFSSMNSIVNLPIDFLKIDKSLIFELLTNNRTVAIIDMLVTFSHKQRYSIVAEGVETEALRDKLTALQVDRSQGYLFSKPLPRGEALMLL